MLFANDYKDNRVYIDDAQSNQTYYCPFCGVPLVTRMGEIRQHHFAHSSNHRCSDTWERGGNYDMTAWHNEWQSLFPKDNQEIKISLGSTQHRADVMIGRTVVEFQHSIMPVKAFDDRNNFYYNLGYRIVWLFDLSDLFVSGSLKYRIKDNNLYFIWDNPKKVFNSYDIKSGCIDLFFQFSEEKEREKIVRVIDVSDSGFEQFKTSAFMTRKDFLEYLGLVDGKCSLPEREDTELNKQFNDFCQKYEISLNSQQQRAVQAVEGANLLLAVPGSGKTTVLVARLGYMVLCRKIAPDNILAITYNKKAAEEMKKRFIEKYGESIGNQIHFSTINSLCNSIYRDYCMKKGLARKKLLDNNDSINIVRDVLKRNSDEYITENEIRDFKQDIAYIKNMMISDSELSKIDFGYSKAFRYYQDLLEKNGLMDFDDQMVFALDFLKKDPEILTEYRSKYRYICVDEAQDTSKIQHEIIRLISEGNNLFMVGDEDQSIYGFRGAYPKALLNFRYEYTNPYIMRMERNYRSTQQIVEAAKSFISKNKGRYEKNMTSERGPGEEVRLIKVKNREAQFCNLLEIAKNNNKEVAFLYRDNESSVVLVDLFLRYNTPFTLRAPEMDFFSTRVVREVMAYLSLAVDPYDYKSLKIIQNKGLIYIRNEQLDYAVKDCIRKRITVFEALQNQMKYVKDDYKHRAKEFKEIIERISNKPPVDAIVDLLNNGYNKYLKEKNYDIGKIEILLILARREETIKAFLQRMDYLKKEIQNGFHSTSDNSVILSTIHSSKGLEYDSVYMVDVYKGRFPSSRQNNSVISKDSSEAEMEERRLFYVGITRAKNHLYLFDIEKKISPYVEELFPEIEFERDKKKREENERREAQYKEQIRQQEQAREEARLREEIARKERQEEEAKKQAKLEEECYRDAHQLIFQQVHQARDRLNRRWIRCEKCGIIGLEDVFQEYGGKNRVNLGVCKACSKIIQQI